MNNMYLKCLIIKSIFFSDDQTNENHRPQLRHDCWFSTGHPLEEEALRERHKGPDSGLLVLGLFSGFLILP